MKQHFSLTSSVRIRDDVLSRDLQGEEVILDLNTGVYFGLDPVGTRIWQGTAALSISFPLNFLPKWGTLFRCFIPSYFCASKLLDRDGGKG
jgi:hypothetical protein